MRDGRMHQTTVRLSPDLWELLLEECDRLGVSAAQFIREAALARLAYAAGRRGDGDWEAALTGAGASVPEMATPSPRSRIDAIAGQAADIGQDNAAVAAQSRLARERSAAVRARSEDLRRRLAASRE